MNVYWMEQTEADVPIDDNWLSADEAVHLSELRVAKRRADWRLGRWTAKRSLSVCLEVPTRPDLLRKFETLAARSGAPEVFFDGQPVAVTISISHRAGIAACAVAMSSAKIGCDLEAIEPRSDAFVADYFTIEEQALVEHASATDRDRLLALLWSAKESALKALHEGLRLDTRSVIVIPCSTSFDLDGWSQLRVRNIGDTAARAGEVHSAGHVFHGWWQEASGIVRTVVADPPPDAPTSLTVSAHIFDSASDGKHVDC